MYYTILLIFLLIAALVALAVVALLSQERVELDDAARAQAPGQFVRLSAGWVHYELANPHLLKDPGLQLVVLVHGFSVPSYAWDPTFAALSKANFPVLRFDLYGRGWSDRPSPDSILANRQVPGVTPYGLEMYLRQLDELLAALKIAAPLCLVGLSMGGPLVSAYANRHPERVKKLVLIDPLVQASSVMPTNPTNVARTAMGGIFTMLALPRSQQGDFHQPGRFPDWAARFRPQMRYKGFRRAILSTLRALPEITQGAGYAALDDLPLQVLLIWGVHDHTIPYPDIDLLRQVITRAEYHAIPGAGHLPHIEQAELVNPLLIRFLATP